MFIDADLRAMIVARFELVGTEETPGVPDTPAGLAAARSSALRGRPPVHQTWSSTAPAWTEPHRRRTSSPGYPPYPPRMNQPSPAIRYGIILTVEIGSAARLLLESLAILEDGRPGTLGADNVADPLFALLAMGMEKLAKLTLGLNALAQGADWPDIATMKGYRHDIVKLDSDARALITTYAHESANGWVQREIDALAADPNIAEILRTKSRYAQEGRFHNLDYLSNRIINDESPAHLWSELEGKIVGPRLMAGLPAGEAAAVFNATVATSIRNWISCYRMAWQQGLFGPEAGLRVSNLSIALDKSRPSAGA